MVMMMMRWAMAMIHVVGIVMVMIDNNDIGDDNRWVGDSCSDDHGTGVVGETGSKPYRVVVLQRDAV